MKPTCIWCWTDEEADGEFVHYVAPCDDDGEPVGEIENCATAAVAVRRADELAVKFGGVEVITDDLKRM